jgi:hypothetical protein
VDTQRDDSLLDTLMADPEVSAAVSALQERLRAATMEGEATLEVDLLGRIVRQLPADVMSDPQQIRLVTVTAVRRLAAEMDGIGPAADLADVVAEKGEISRLLFDASQALLGRTGDADNHHPEIQDLLAQDGGSEGNEGARRDRDAAARRDPASILEAIAQLPPPWSEPLDTANVGRLDEQVGVHLHVIANADRTVNQQIEGRAMRGLERLLPHPDASAYAVIQQYLVPAPDERGSGWEERRARVLAAMRRTSLSERLRDAGLVTADDAVASFPRGFGLYLDSLDPADGVDLAELDGVVERIGSKRLHEATEELLGAENVLEPPRTRRVLSARTKTMLPFVRLCLTHGDEDTTRQGMEALRRIYATEEVGCLLSLFGSERTLPSWYVDALADDAFDGVAGEALKRKLGGELVRFVRGAEGNTELRTRRIQAIHDLANFPTSDGNILLTDLVEARRFFVLPREPRAIRLAARKALQAKTHRRRAGRVS